MDGEKEPGLGLMASIFLVPQIFGWLVFRPGYSLMTRMVVMVYMVIATIPAYFLIMTLWTSGDQIKGMARDFDRNREVASRNAGEARGYMQDYENAELSSSGTAPTKDTDNLLRVSSVELAKAAENGRDKLAQYDGATIVVTGKTMSEPADGIIYLEGGETYPSVRLHYASTPPGIAKGEQLTAQCTGMSLAPSGPDLASCQ